MHPVMEILDLIFLMLRKVLNPEQIELSTRKWFQYLPETFYNSSTKSGFIRISKGFSCKYSKMLTQEFSGGFPAQKSAGSIKDSSKLLSSLQHLLTTSERAIDSGENLVGSFLPSYLKAGCFRCCRG